MNILHSAISNISRVFHRFHVMDPNSVYYIYLYIYIYDLGFACAWVCAGVYTSNRLHIVTVISATARFDNNYMCANPDKFQSVILSRDGQQSLSILVQDNTILSDKTKKAMGVTLDNRLKIDKHVSSLCIKASRQIIALKRISNYLDENCRILIFKSFISSNFSYCPVFRLFCGKTNLNKLEKLQERALPLVFPLHTIVC